MSLHIHQLMKSQRILLLQGPMGNYFTQLARWLEFHNKQYYKVNFNGGDWFFSRGLNNLNYRGKLSYFDDWLISEIKDKQIDAIVCFGDCRFYHRIAKRVAVELKVDFFVFEEGYVRPNYITFEQNGVNDFSDFRNFYESSDQTIPDLPLPDHPQEVYPSFSFLIRTAITFYLMWVLCTFLYPHYRHHRMIRPTFEVFYWFRAGVRKLINKQVDTHRFLNLIQHHTDRYYIVALQVHNDSQVQVHSDYVDVRDFIQEVTASFASHSDDLQHLVFKHHPMDRGYRHYGNLLRELAKEYDLEGRVHYVCDVHLPTLMKHSLGIVTINSTTGIQALHHGKPVIALGRAIYNLPKLTFQGGLDQFWKNPGRVNRLHYRRFRYALVHYSQLNGAYYGQSPWMKNYDEKRLENRFNYTVGGHTNKEKLRIVKD
ncbi:capsular biosynthesis protein [Acinetobacter sp. A3.8]|uniref:Capsular biosynthesis protein n=1 Tax=Acinetobacter sedimenti TaxID=2919922 RepID=A0A9X2B671_9GAMM|nr:capsular biosynthesis protein [Acinetobacter sedimenti]MCJ8145822.1 capsular biosynthesis protein [Acinetobacter sedimenti]